LVYNFSHNKKFDAAYLIKKKPGVAREPNPVIAAAFKKLMEASLKVFFRFYFLNFSANFLDYFEGDPTKRSSSADDC
jgi:hypothetical protein